MLKSFATTVDSRLEHSLRGALYALYAVAVGVSVSVWFLAFRAPLWLDETISMFIVKGRLSEMLSRQGWPGVPAYPFLLWLWTRTLGTSEASLRMSSVLAMLAAAYLLYRSARELFDWDVAICAVVLFCLHPVIVPEAIDIRPYAFAVLAITASIYALLRLHTNDSNWLAALFGLSAACIVYFQFLFVVIVPALLICFFGSKWRGDRRVLWRQFAIALVVFVLAFLPVLPGLQYLFHTSGTHVFSTPPRLAELGQVLVQRRPALILAAVFVIAALTRRVKLRGLFEGWPAMFSVSLSLVPILILYGVSVGTSIHIFVERYRVVAVPGVALCWALVIRRIDSRALRLLFCLAVAGVAAHHYASSPSARAHNYTWKYALEFAQKDALPDNAPLLICSDLPESDYLPIPSGSSVKDNALFAPLSYYQVSVPVVGLPRAMNADALRIGSHFLQQAAQRRQRFLALAFLPSYDTLDWLAENAEGSHTVRELGVFDGVRVLEFVPRGP